MVKPLYTEEQGERTFQDFTNDLLRIVRRMNANLKSGHGVNLTNDELKILSLSSFGSMLAWSEDDPEDDEDQDFTGAIL